MKQCCYICGRFFPVLKTKFWDVLLDPIWHGLSPLPLFSICVLEVGLAPLLLGRVVSSVYIQCSGISFEEVTKASWMNSLFFVKFSRDFTCTLLICFNILKASSHEASSSQLILSRSLHYVTLKPRASVSPVPQEGQTGVGRSSPASWRLAGQPTPDSGFLERWDVVPWSPYHEHVLHVPF